eukprot:gnl/TRDRNA2_/TRDRNA2_82229_c0_seq2.p1 gnl/TRDRNA2_/TRDRNA2_82229_c0~~gnl/TRDRNA2_/TRDRNA2_82229_c0_seq2.p1  ORF type:complete len:426 (+),score=61.11 gnl/TRDRNA2_/TRDRNA2_82229_c0_seq2:44-1321(+)
MRAAVALVLVAVLQAAAESSTATFKDFIEHYGRSYVEGTNEYEERQALFNTRLEAVQRQNLRSDRLWTAAINHLSDWSEHELKALRGWRGRKHASVTQGGEVQSLVEANKTLDLPEEHSWQKLKASALNHDQGACGSCWAVATVTTMQAHSEIYRPDASRAFSAQELVNCVPNPEHCGGEGGCKGATIELAMDYIMHNGLSTPEETPYEGMDRVCKAKKSTEKAKAGEHVLLQIGTKSFERFAAADVVEDFSRMTAPSEGAGEELGTVGVRYGDKFGSAGQAFGLFGWERLPENSYEPLLRAVAERGPVAISAAASGWFQYSSGIFDSCPKDVVVDHAVVLIGYGKSGATKYWTIKNSWGSSWGEHGLIRLVRSDDDGTAQCGTDAKPEVGTGCDGGPSSVTVCGHCGVLYDSVVPHFVSDQVGK